MIGIPNFVIIAIKEECLCQPIGGSRGKTYLTNAHDMPNEGNKVKTSDFTTIAFDNIDTTSKANLNKKHSDFRA